MNKVKQDIPKAIETHFQGYRFRSRLEGKWAVFLEAIGVQWVYEKEGFDLGKKAGWYLPDFWVEDWQHWVEIKPAGFFAQEEGPEHKKIKAFHLPLLYIEGGPWAGGEVIRHGTGAGTISDQSIRYGQFARCKGGCPGMSLLATKVMKSLPDNHQARFLAFGPHTCQRDRWPIVTSNHDAYRAARSADFKRGEPS